MLASAHGLAMSLAAHLRSARRILVFTGAGVSTASGIPDFRGPNGIWTRRRPVLFDDFLASEASRIEYWDYKLETWEIHARAQPNAVQKDLHDARPHERPASAGGDLAASADRTARHGPRRQVPAVRGDERSGGAPRAFPGDETGAPVRVRRTAQIGDHQLRPTAPRGRHRSCGGSRRTGRSRPRTGIDLVGVSRSVNSPDCRGTRSALHHRQSRRDGS